MPPSLAEKDLKDIEKKNHNSGMKQTSHHQKNVDGYSKEIGSDTDETGYGEGNVNRPDYITTMQGLSGDHSVYRDHQNWAANMPGNPHSMITDFGSIFGINSLIKQAVVDSYKEQLRRVLSRLKKGGKIPEGTSLDEVKIDIPGRGPMTLHDMSEELARQALKVVIPLTSDLTSTESTEPDTAASAAEDQQLPDLGELDQAMGGLASLGGGDSMGVPVQASLKLAETGLQKDRIKKLVNKKPTQTFAPNYTHRTDEMRKLPEGESRYDKDINTKDIMGGGVAKGDTETHVYEDTSLTSDPMSNYTRTVAN